MEKFGFVYIWYDRKRKRFYIGSHWGTETDGYICSSNWMRDAHRRRPNDFKRKIIARVYSNRSALYREEERWIAMIKRHEIRERYYNLHLGSTTHWTATDKLQSISEKISTRTKAAMQRPDVRKKYEAGLKTRDLSFRTPEWNERIKQTCAAKQLNKGMLTVRYPHEDKCFHVTADDPRWISGEVISVNRKYAKVTKVKMVYHTPWGDFANPAAAAKECPYGSVCEDVIWHWCKKKNNEIFTNKGRPPKILQPEWLGKTRKDVGFGYGEKT